MDRTSARVGQAFMYSNMLSTIMKPFLFLSFLPEKGIVMPFAKAKCYVLPATNLAALVMDWGGRWFGSNKTNSTPSFVMMPAVSLPHLPSFSASLAVRRNSMFGHVIFMAFHYFQILWSVVKTKSVDMVNFFTASKPPSNRLLSNYNVLKYSIVGFLSARVISVYHGDVAVSGNAFSCFVTRVNLWMIPHILIPARSAPRLWIVLIIVYWLFAVNALAVEVGVFSHTGNLTTCSMDCKNI